MKITVWIDESGLPINDSDFIVTLIFIDNENQINFVKKKFNKWVKDVKKHYPIFSKVEIKGNNFKQKWYVFAMFDIVIKLLTWIDNVYVSHFKKGTINVNVCDCKRKDYLYNIAVINSIERWLDHNDIDSTQIDLYITADSYHDSQNKNNILKNWIKRTFGFKSVSFNAVDSKTNPEVQIADLISFCIFRFITGGASKLTNGIYEKIKHKVKKPNNIRESFPGDKCLSNCGKTTLDTK